MDVQRLPILRVSPTLLEVLLMYSGIREFHKSFCMSFAVQGNRTARKNLSARSMPYRSYLCMLMSNAPPALPELNMGETGHWKMLCTTKNHCRSFYNAIACSFSQWQTRRTRRHCQLWKGLKSFSCSWNGNKDTRRCFGI